MYAQPIILASSSPRRQSLLESLGFSIEIIPSQFEEIIPDGMDIYHSPMYLAEGKVQEVSQRLKTNKIILGADTIVIHEGVIKGKPESLEEARQTLLSMADNEHEVITGVSILQGNSLKSFSVLSKVYFDPISNKEIDYYFANAEVLDKAGSYGIQDWIGVAKIRRIEGSYTNIMGLPTSEVYACLTDYYCDGLRCISKCRNIMPRRGGVKGEEIIKATF